AGAVLPLGDDAFELRVLERMVLRADGEALVRLGRGRSLRHGPRGHHPVELQPEIPMQLPGGVHLDDEHATARYYPAAKEFGRAGRVALLAVRGEAGVSSGVVGGGHYWKIRPGPSRAGALRSSLRPGGTGSYVSAMAARAIGTSTISFGLVSLPVKVYSTAESSSKVSFNMMWKERGVRVRQQYIDPADGTVVPREEIVKGYEFAKDQYVLFTKEELEVVEAPKSDEIEIVSFVPVDTVDRLFLN